MSASAFTPVRFPPEGIPLGASWHLTRNRSYRDSAE